MLAVIHQVVGEDVPRGAEGASMRASNQFADATTGVVYIHASPAAVCPHVEWALSSTLDSTGESEVDAAARHARAAACGHQLASGRSAPAAAGERAALVVGAAIRGHRGPQPRRRRPPLVPHPAAGPVERCDERQRRRHGRRDAAAHADGRRAPTRWPPNWTRCWAPHGTTSLEPYRDGGDSAEVSWLNRGVG